MPARCRRSARPRRRLSPPAVRVALGLAMLVGLGAVRGGGRPPGAAALPLRQPAAPGAIFLPLAYGGGARIDGALPFAGLAFVADEGSRLAVFQDTISLRPREAGEPAGLTAHTGDAGGLEVRWERIDAARLQPGMLLEIASHDEADAALGRVAIATGELGLDLRVEPARDAGASHHVELRLAGRVVARLAGHTGVAARAPTWPIGYGRVEAHPGALPATRLVWDRAVAINVPRGPIVEADELVVRAESAEPPGVMARLRVRLEGIPRVVLQTPVLRLPLEGCPEAAPLAPDGSVVFPAERDPAREPVYVDVAGDLEGHAGALHGAGRDASLDAWYGEWPCAASIGGDLSPEPAPPAADLAALGLASSAEAIAAELGRLDAAIAAGTSPPSLGAVSPIDGRVEAPTAAFRPDAAAPYGGRDIVFVHDLVADPLADAAAGDPMAIAGWQADFGGATAMGANPAFFLPGSYWKAAADASWATHVGRLAGYGGRDNRYLTVAWPATQRLDVGAHAVLAQIAAAMDDGTGVVVPVGGTAEGFCQRPSCVVVSHGAGALLVDVALHAAATGALTGTAAAAIPERVKAHVALHGAFGGSELAAAVVGQGLGLSRLSDGCALATLAYRALDPDALRPAPACPAMAPLADSSLRDLVPGVATARMAAIAPSIPVPALLVAGAHPTFPSALKHAALPGYDDGALTLDSQCASPAAPAERPSRYDPLGAEGRSFDLGLAPSRAAGFRRDQAPAGMAAGCTPFVSPAGMLQPVADALAGTARDALARLPGHHAFLLTASDHETGPRAGRIDRDYRDSQPGGARGWEEVRVITDPAVYAPDERFAAIDPAPLIARPPAVEVHARGRRVDFDVVRLGRTYRRSWWLWRRTYLLAEGSEARDAVDFVYGHVLRP